MFALTAYAQSGGTTVRGTVKDPQGNLVSGATVTLTDPARNFTRTQFKLPWEGHALQFRWEVFNVTNTQRFDGLTIADLSLGQDPFLGGNPTSDFGRFTSTQAPLNETKAGRVMQFALRYTF